MRSSVATWWQILLEPAVVHELTEVAVGRRNHTNVDVFRSLCAKWLDFALLQDPQQLGLHRSPARPSTMLGTP
jgi:hypothetical protein